MSWIRELSRLLLPEGLHMPDVGVGGRSVWVGIEVGGEEVDEGGSGGLVDVDSGAGVLLAVAIGEVAGGVVGADVHMVVGDGVVVRVAPAVPIAVVASVGLAVDVPGVPDGVVESMGVEDAVIVSAGCDARAVDSAGWKGVGDGAGEGKLSEGRTKSRL
jgi:hypothetical protein